MTINSWSLFYDASMDQNIFNLKMNNDPNRYKYDEDTILKELSDYISDTYNAHYSAGSLSLIHISEPTRRS